jgi:arginase
MSSPDEQRVARIFGVPMDLGQQRRGVDMGPSAVRYAGLQDRLARLGYAVFDGGNIAVPVVEEIVGRSEPSVEGGEHRARHLDSVVRVCQSIYEQMGCCVADHEFAIFLGGDHSISVGSVAGASKRGSTGLIWIDAHADFNTPQTSPSGNIHGMPVAALLGDGPRALVDVGYPGAKLQPSHVAMIGIRNLDLEERRRLSESEISVFTMTDIDEHGIASITRQALSRLSHLDTIHVSLDMDALDPEVAPGVGTPVPGGLTYREAHLVMEILCQSNKVMSLDIVEINPILDNRNQTAKLAVELAASLLGQRII